VECDYEAEGEEEQQQGAPSDHSFTTSGGSGRGAGAALEMQLFATGPGSCGGDTGGGEGKRGRQGQRRQRWGQRRGTWQHVDAVVAAPSETVQPHRPCCPTRRSSQLACVGLLLLLLLAQCSSIWTWYQAATADAAAAADRCKPVALPHGSVVGMCDGVPGSTCEYKACDEGYALVPAIATVVVGPAGAAAATSAAGQRGGGHRRFVFEYGYDEPQSALAARPPGGSPPVLIPEGPPSAAAAVGAEAEAAAAMGPVVAVAPGQRYVNGSSTSSSVLLLDTFPPCGTCFGVDGLMCEPLGRTFPLPHPDDSAGGHSGVHTHPGDTGTTLEYLYACPSDRNALLACEAQQQQQQQQGGDGGGGGGGRLCYGRYDGYRPCEKVRKKDEKGVCAFVVDCL
jgi:hypothetical protein